MCVKQSLWKIITNFPFQNYLPWIKFSSHRDNIYKAREDWKVLVQKGMLHKKKKKKCFAFDSNHILKYIDVHIKYWKASFIIYDNHISSFTSSDSWRFKYFFVILNSYHFCQSDSTLGLLVHKNVKELFNFPFNTHVVSL